MQNYPSKLLLLGEYTIIQNSAALAIPYFHYQSHWSDHSDRPHGFKNTITTAFSQQSLKKILGDLQSLTSPLLDLKRFETDLLNGLWLCTNSPMGYGLGSSGAVCAAIYDRYALEKQSNLSVLKQELALLEHSFHGKSSGIDPLIAYSQLPLLVQTDKTIVSSSIQLPSPEQGSIFLIDTKQPRVSTPLINFFVEQCQKASFLSDFVQPVCSAIDEAIEALHQVNFEQLMQSIAVISRLQFNHLPPMIPEMVHPLWKKGLASGEFYLKICGAGGGGFMLGFANNWDNVAKYFKDFNILHIH